MLHLLVLVLFSQEQTDGLWRSISYASRALTPVEQRYSQIEKESLAILFGVSRFRMYLYGMKFTVFTDHKPLVSMFTSTKSQLPPRIERWVFRLMPYDFTVSYLPGSKNSADYLSRSNPLPSTHKSNMVEEYINSVVSQFLPIALPLAEIQKETNKDKTLSLLKKCKLKLELKDYHKVYNDISVSNELVMLNNKNYNSFYPTTHRTKTCT